MESLEYSSICRGKLPLSTLMGESSSDEDIAELKEMDHWIRKHTLQKFGPVRQVEAFHVFEIGFEGIARSTRHKSGIALRFPRILRWRQDVGPEDADHFTHFEALMSDSHAV